MQEKLQTLAEHILACQSEFPSAGVVHQGRVVATTKHKNENREAPVSTTARPIQVESSMWHPA